MCKITYPKRYYRIKEVMYNSAKRKFYPEFTDCTPEEQEFHGNVCWQPIDKIGYESMLECEEQIKYNRTHDYRITEINHYKV